MTKILKQQVMQLVSGGREGTIPAASVQKWNRYFNGKENERIKDLSTKRGRACLEKLGVARNFIAQKEYKNAYEIFKELMELIEGLPGLASEVYEEAASCALQINERKGALELLWKAATTNQGLGKWGEAARVYEKLGRSYREEGDPLASFHNYDSAARFYLKAGVEEKAVECYKCAGEESQKVGHKKGALMYFILAGEIKKAERIIEETE